MTAPARQFVLTLSCPDRTGIVARIATFLADAGAWITEAAYHADQDTNWFFTRQVVRADSVPFSADELRQRFAAVAAELGGHADWRVWDTATKRRIVILVSREGHCLYDLLGRVSSGELDVELSAVIGNHPHLGAVTRAHGIPFHHVVFPSSGADVEGKAAAFAELRQHVDAHRPHAVVLARFMQVLPRSLCAAWAGRTLRSWTPARSSSRT